MILEEQNCGKDIFIGKLRVFDKEKGPEASPPQALNGNLTLDESESLHGVSFASEFVESRFKFLCPKLIVFDAFDDLEFSTFRAAREREDETFINSVLPTRAQAH